MAAFGTPAARPGTTSFTPVRAGSFPKAPSVPKGNAGMTFTLPKAPALTPSVPKVTQATSPFPATPGATPTAAAPTNSGTQTPNPNGAPGVGAVPNPNFQGDATYYQALATALAPAQTAIIGDQKSIADAGTTLNTVTLPALRANLALQNTATENAENARGGFAQGALGLSLGNNVDAEGRTEAADQLAYQQDVGNWNAAIAGIQAGLSPEIVGLQLASAGRSAGQVASSQGTLGTAPPTGPPAYGPPGPAKVAGPVPGAAVAEPRSSSNSKPKPAGKVATLTFGAFKGAK